MAIIYGSGTKIIRFIQTDAEREQYGDPTQYDTALEFDPDTNPQIIDGLAGRLPNVRWQDASLINGVLYYNDEPVTINPPSETYQDRVYLRDWWQRLSTALDNVATAITQTEQAEAIWPSLTPAQKQTWLVDHFDEVLGALALVLRMIQGVLRFIRWFIKVYLGFEL